MFRYLLDRSIFAKFHSSAIDGNKRLSSSLRNTYTSPFISTYENNKNEIPVADPNSGEKTADYLDFMAKNYFDLSKGDEAKNQGKESITGW
ncbi:Uncharacterised protein, partial [Mycoplasma putrefaciens]